jgi:hypothetical protein
MNRTPADSHLDAHFDALNLVLSRLYVNRELTSAVLEQDYPREHWQHVMFLLADVAAVGMLSTCGQSAAIILLESERQQLIRQREGLE